MGLETIIEVLGRGEKGLMGKKGERARGKSKGGKGIKRSDLRVKGRNVC